MAVGHPPPLNGLAILYHKFCQKSTIFRCSDILRESAMANPLSGLKPALEVLAQNVDILPATGQAVEEMTPTKH
jgi:hypothetical protein